MPPAPLAAAARGARLPLAPAAARLFVGSSLALTRTLLRSRARQNCEIFHGDGKEAERRDLSYTDSFILGWWDEKANETGNITFVYFKNALVSEKY